MEKPSEIRKKREKDREGALALKSLDDIKKENIERYATEICSKIFGVSKTELNPTNLQKAILKLLNGKLSLYNLYNSSDLHMNKYIRRKSICSKV